MSQLFLIRCAQDGPCAAQLRAELAALGYSVVDGGAAPDWQGALRASRAALLLWGAAAAADATVAEQLARARWLHVRLAVVATDATPLPAEARAAPVVPSAPPCAGAAALLQAHLPPPAPDDALLDQLLAEAPGAGGARIAGDNAHTFGVRCKNQHVSYFDKREVCRASGSVFRVTGEDKRRDLLRLRCGAPGCGEWVVVEVDCEGYR